MIAQTLTAATQSSGIGLETIGPIVTILTIVYAGWARIRAARLDALLRAAIVGVKAGLESLDKTSAEIVKAEIEKAAGGKTSDLNQDLKAEVRKTTTALPVYRDDGLPKLGGLLLLGLFLSSGCVSAAIHDSALEAQRSAAILHKASVANPAYSDADKAAWSRLWESHEKALAAVEEASR